MTIPTLRDESNRNDKYILPRNAVEQERLQNQHELITEAADGRLILDKNIKLGPGSRVLDSATGAASWILDLIYQVPKNVEFVGVDISTSMFPDDVPSNVSLYELSSMDLPSSWDNTFDLINQRLLIAAFTVAQWQKALSKLFRVLKPEGAIQLVEIGEHSSLIKPNSTPATESAYTFSDTIFKKRGLLGKECGRRLPTLLQEAGFSNIHVEVHQVPLGRQWGEVGEKGSRNWEIVYRMFGNACLAEGGLGVCKSQAEVEAVVERAKKEWDEIPGVFTQVYAITARKPL